MQNQPQVTSWLRLDHLWPVTKHQYYGDWTTNEKCPATKVQAGTVVKSHAVNSHCRIELPQAMSCLQPQMVEYPKATATWRKQWCYHSYCPTIVSYWSLGSYSHAKGNMNKNPTQYYGRSNQKLLHGKRNSRGGPNNVALDIMVARIHVVQYILHIIYIYHVYILYIQMCACVNVHM